MPFLFYFIYFFLFIYLFFYLKSNRLLEPIQEYEKREEEGGRGGERMRSDLDVSCGNT
jgi:hypothetical protein